MMVHAIYWTAHRNLTFVSRGLQVFVAVHHWQSGIPAMGTHVSLLVLLYNRRRARARACCMWSVQKSMAESVQCMPYMLSSVKNTSASNLGALYDLGSHLGDCIHFCQSFGSYCSLGCPTSWSVLHWARGANKIAMAHSMSTLMSLWSSYKSCFRSVSSTTCWIFCWSLLC